MTCLFCKINKGTFPCISIYENNHCHVIVDKFKLNKGHLLVISKHHQQSITQLSQKERSQLINTASKVIIAMKEVSQEIKDVHLLINDGPGAYQHIPHVHLHLIPRYQFDLPILITNIFTRYMNPFNYKTNKKIQCWAHQLSHHIKVNSNDETNC
ncbi:HIT family protein [uncultured Shewanella sp.]|uniref:HIT family protein n=1 Tax=uncultured Shewanella sp. TaxID=173975 RepID=UPI002634E295|nr:HIT family protein [uncultured Shewanella sp.]